VLGLGLAHGDRVAALGKNSDAYLLTQSEPTAAFVDAALTEHVEAVEGRLGELHRGALRDDVLAWALDDDAPEHAEDGVRDDDLVQLLYTSGTTSQPKGAMLTHRALVHEYASCIAALDISADDAPLHTMPLYHSAQMHVFLLPALAVGATNHLLEAPDLDAVLERVPPRRHHVALLPAHGLGRAGQPPRPGRRRPALPAPRLLRRLDHARPRARAPAGAPARGRLPQLLRPVRDRTAGDRPAPGGARAAAGLGRALGAVRGDPCRRRRPAGRAAGRARRGRLPLAPALHRLLGKPEATAEAFAGGWFHSGDLVRSDDEGYLFVVDRIKDVVNTGGVLVASRELEDALYGHVAVAEVAVVGLPHERWIEAIAAVVVLKEDVEPQALIDYAKGRLAPHKVPKSVHPIDELPKNASGKVLKRELRRQLGGSESAVGRVPG
jgi:fatty-acyl-CoA synthase